MPSPGLGPGAPGSGRSLLRVTARPLRPAGIAAAVVGVGDETRPGPGRQVVERVARAAVRHVRIAATSIRRPDCNRAKKIAEGRVPGNGERSSARVRRAEVARRRRPILRRWRVFDQRRVRDDGVIPATVVRVVYLVVQQVQLAVRVCNCMVVAADDEPATASDTPNEGAGIGINRAIVARLSPRTRLPIDSATSVRRRVPLAASRVEPVSPLIPIAGLAGGCDRDGLAVDNIDSCVDAGGPTVAST